MRQFLPLAGLCALAACAPAQMHLPDSFPVSSTRTEFSGFTGWNHGKFTAGRYLGEYERSEDRLVFLDTYKVSSAHGEFSVSGPGIASTIEARCAMREHSVDTGRIEVLTSPMAYGCDFAAAGRPYPARFELHEAHSDPLKPYDRRGVIEFEDETISIRSVHKIVGTSLPTLAPIGYVFEQDGRPVGAVELNGNPALILPAGTDARLTRTLTLAALALGVLYDPANAID